MMSANRRCICQAYCFRHPTYVDVIFRETRKLCTSIRLTMIVFVEILEVKRPEEKTIQLFITKRPMNLRKNTMIDNCQFCIGFGKQNYCFVSMRSIYKHER